MEKGIRREVRIGHLFDATKCITNSPCTRMHVATPRAVMARGNACVLPETDRPQRNRVTKRKRTGKESRERRAESVHDREKRKQTG